MYSNALYIALLASLAVFVSGQQVVCPDGTSYDVGPPYTTPTRPVPPPRCIEYPVRYLLSNRSNPMYPVVYSILNISKIADSYDPSIPTVMVFHGFTESADTVFMRNITAVYLTKVNANAIYVDYSNITTNVDYFQDVSDIRVAATYVIKAVQLLIDLGTNPSDIHLVGFSLGAQLAALVGKAVSNIGRITGLDPAGPAFTNQSCEVRLCQGDALFTEAIHTNGHPLIGFGTSDEDADVDLWVNGGWDQPNCGVTVDAPDFLTKLLETQSIQEGSTELPCSHIRAPLVYAEALASSCTFWGKTPTDQQLSESRLELGYPTKSLVPTQGCTLTTCVPIGLQTIDAAGRGNIIVPTNYESPFCVSQQ